MAANALGFLMGAGSILAPLVQDTKKPESGTSVQIIVGSGPNSLAGGNVPHIALWDDDGNRIGQYHPSKKDKLKDGGSFPDAGVNVKHTQNGGDQLDPGYIMLSNLENDAICLSAIIVSNPRIAASFYGDTGHLCGQSWFLSETPIGNTWGKPKCVWLDADHSNGINARALSFHIRDMASSQDMLDQYTQYPETLCKSTPRFSFWGNLLPDGTIPFFDPKLQYEDTGSIGQGKDVDPQRVVDKPHQYNKAVYLHQGEQLRRSSSRRSNGKARGSNQNPEHLIITDHEQDDVREVCESDTSFGWDIASTYQKLFCDMEVKQLYPFCDEHNVKDSCFDFEAKTIIPRGGLEARDKFADMVPWKNYTSEAHWKK